MSPSDEASDPREDEKDDKKKENRRPQQRDPRNEETPEMAQDDATADSLSTSVFSSPLPTLLALTPGTHNGTPVKPIGFPRDLQRRTLRDEIYLLSGATMVSLAAFLYIVLPFTALMSLATMFMSLGMIGMTTSNYVRDVVRERGLVEFLPESIWQMLTQTSIHDWMTDPTFMLENRHLLLYFIPGVNPEQRDRYIDRLAPRHRESLRRPGLGWAFGGENLMRIVLGEEGVRQATSPPRQPRIEVEDQAPATTIETPSRRLYSDDSSAASDLGLDISTNDLAGGLSDTQATDLARRIGVNTYAPVASTNALTWQVMGADHEANHDDDDDEDLDELYALEERILTDAIWTSFYSFLNPVVQYMTDTATDMAQPTTRTLMRYSTGLAFFSGGVGLLGYWQGAFGLPRILSRPSSDSIWTTAFLGAGTAGVLWYARSRWLSGNRNSDNPTETNSSTPTDSTSFRKTI